MAFASFFKSSIKQVGKAGASAAIKAGQNTVLSKMGYKSTAVPLPKTVAAPATKTKAKATAKKATAKKTTVKKTTVKAGVPMWAWAVGGGVALLAFMKR